MQQRQQSSMQSIQQILVFLVAFALMYNPNAALAQEDSVNADALQKRFSEVQEELRAVAIETQRLGVKYINATTGDEAYKFLEQYEAKRAEGNALVEKWIPIGEQLFETSIASGEPVDENLAIFATQIMSWHYENGQYEKAYGLCEKLVGNDPTNQFAEVYMSRSGMLTNHFSKRIAAILLENEEYFQNEKSITQTEKIIIESFYYLDGVFQQELKLRKEEAEADDLPRVEFATSQGNFVIELFENEAPDTVGNFISLTEAKHFDNLLFHAVISQTAAETGKLDTNFRPREIGYEIYDEHDKPDHRKIFAGSVVMYRDRPNSADSRFFVALAPLPNLHGKQTVFGRVIEGMDTLYKLNKTYKIEEEKQIQIVDAVPDKVISAKVLRKRDHDYKPNKVVPK